MPPLQADVLQKEDSFLETRKNQLLAALYAQSFPLVEKIYKHIREYAFNTNDHDENCLKLLNQIQTIIKQFSPQLFDHPAINIKEDYDALGHFISRVNKRAIHQPRYVEFDAWKDSLGLKSTQEALLFKTVMTLQLSCGCSNFCRRCNEWALPGVRGHFTYSAVTQLIDAIIANNNDEISLFGASDPLDWQHDKKNISDIIRYLEPLSLGYSILTKAPKGKAFVLRQLIEQQANLSVSVTNKNKNRVTQIEQDLETNISKQHDTDDLMIPAGLDEDFISIKPSITDGYGSEITPDGAFIIIPTFTSALNPFGHAKIPITPETKFFPEKKTGRHALLVDYFKPLQGFDLDHTPCHLSDLLDVQIESILQDHGEDELTPPGMRSVKEYLSIFEEKARRQRKKMTLSVIRHLKKQFLSNSRFKQLSEQNRVIYIQKIRRHLDLCKKESCFKTKLHTLSFFLEQIVAYIQKYKTRTRIIRFLLNPEIEKRLSNRMEISTQKDLLSTFQNTHLETFDVFRYLVSCLLCNENSSPVAEFIADHPADYDTIGDIFVPRTVKP